LLVIPSTQEPTMPTITTAAELARARGRRLALEMLAELESDPDVAEACLVPAIIEGPPADVALWGTRRASQRVILLEYIDRIRADRPALEGFCSVLSDWIASSAGGAVPIRSRYEKYLTTGRDTIRL
jgi:hypothetical protein